MRKEKVSMENDINRLADFLATLIEKYVGVMELESLPDPQRPQDD